MRFKSRSRALAASALAASLGLAGLGLVAPAAQASEPTEATRIEGLPTYEGGTRYETAAEAATTAYDTGADNVILASGEKFPDALAGGGLAGQLDAPILLTLQDQLPESTIEALAALDPTTVTIVGESEAVSDAVEAELVALGYGTDRIGGADRFETAALIAEELDGTTAVLANGLKFPDALAISPGAHELELPLLLTTADTLHEDAAAYIDANSIDTVVIVGDVEVVSQDIEDALEADGITVNRLGGATRYETAIEIAEFHTTVGFTLDEVVLARGDKFPDALAGGPLAASMMAPMVLTQSDVLTPATGTWLSSNCQDIDALTIMGGPAAIAETVVTAAQAAAQCDTNQDFAVAPAGAQSDTTGGTDVDYTVTGITSATVDIALVDCDNVTRDGDIISFADADGVPAGSGNNVADGIDLDNTDTAAFFSASNGVATAGEPEYLDDVVVVNGAVTYSVNSNELGCVVAVAFADPDGGDDLDLDANNQPTDAFAVTGEVTFNPPAATTGTLNENVASVDKANNQFVGCELGLTPDTDTAEGVDNADCDQFTYDANDQFFIDADDDNVAQPGEQATLDQFEAQLSRGDDVTGNYNANPALVSTFILEDESPMVPVVSATPTSATTIAVSITNVEPGGQIRLFLDEDSDDGADEDASVFPAEFTLVRTLTAADDIDAVTPGIQTVITVPAATNSPDAAGPCGAGTRDFTVAATQVIDGDESTPGFDIDNCVPDQTPDTAAPQAVDTELAVSGGLGNVLDTGDVIEICFNEVIADPADADLEALQVQDADGTIATLTQGTNATFTLGAAASTVTNTGTAACPANQTLRVTVTGAPTVNAAGTTAGVQFPANIVDAGEIEDLAGNLFAPAGDPDVAIDTTEGAEPS
jgi:putative cell wall-binding protein